MVGELDQPVTQEETADQDLAMITHLEDRMTTEETGMKEAILTMTEDIKRKEATAEIEGTVNGQMIDNTSNSIMATAGKAHEGVAGRL